MTLTYRNIEELSNHFNDAMTWFLGTHQVNDLATLATTQRDRAAQLEFLINMLTVLNPPAVTEDSNASSSHTLAVSHGEKTAEEKEERSFASASTSAAIISPMVSSEVLAFYGATLVVHEQIRKEYENRLLSLSEVSNSKLYKAIAEKIWLKESLSAEQQLACVEALISFLKNKFYRDGNFAKGIQAEHPFQAILPKMAELFGIACDMRCKLKKEKFSAEVRLNASSRAAARAQNAIKADEEELALLESVLDLLEENIYSSPPAVKNEKQKNPFQPVPRETETMYALACDLRCQLEKTRFCEAVAQESARIQAEKRQAEEARAEEAAAEERKRVEAMAATTPPTTNSGWGIMRLFRSSNTAQASSSPAPKPDEEAPTDTVAAAPGGEGGSNFFQPAPSLATSSSSASQSSAAAAASPP